MALVAYGYNKQRTHKTIREEKKREEEKSESGNLGVLVVLLFEIAGIIIINAIIAVSTKRTFLPPPFVWGMGTSCSSLALLEKITKRYQSNNYFVSLVPKGTLQVQQSWEKNSQLSQNCTW